ncbi:uncharacterized protein [Rutidosis leptorrhynchoides]|uniref:uncharacterized protein n=1 Tax=Rutidosis leptorrhynchoides TaxID=125765 RepID=UPI003A99964A
MNFAASLSKRFCVSDLVKRISVYSSATDVTGNGLSMVFRRWSTKKSAGCAKNLHDSKPKYLGLKKFGGERVIPGNIIIRQRGTRFHPGDYVGMGKDHTLFALKEGTVRFEHRNISIERNKIRVRKLVHVDPKEGHLIHPIYLKLAADATKSDVSP